MLATIAGWIWILTGILFFVSPGVFRAVLTRRSIKHLRRILFAVTLMLSALLIGIAVRADGIIAKIVMAMGIIGIVKAVFFLASRSSEKVIAWFAQQPLNLFRIGAATQILIGVLLLKLG